MKCCALRALNAAAADSDDPQAVARAWLVDEGFAREMINKIQFMRKEAGFDVVDRINVTYEAGDRLKAAVERFASRVAAETLAASITEGAGAGELEREWDVNGEWARIAVERVERSSSG